jgi:hypothetical protein
MQRVRLAYDRIVLGQFGQQILRQKASLDFRL